MDIIDSLAVARDGLVTTGQLTEIGLHHGTIRRLVSQQTLVRVARGVYALPLSDLDARQVHLRRARAHLAGGTSAAGPHR
ncbi:MAG: type IV toxin-antitoxin system AbiEi family antitoxin domain-containing protein [Propionibacteriales bacterium]|nr:type IV toxin-antitoxin system AbiEi family antitoxin domain-containing protein [Propionibacteriales bacterium]